MKRSILLAGLCFNTIMSFGQKSEHQIFVGANSTATNTSFYNNQYKGFKNPNYGFTAGYKFIHSLYKGLSLSGGITFTTFKADFGRPMYSATISNPVPGVQENLKFSRFSIPIQAYYNFVKKENFIFYATFGVGFIFSERVNRTADYYVPTPPAGYKMLTYMGKQTIKFNDGDNSLGTTLFGGVGSNFNIKHQRFNVELTYGSDNSKSKIYSLHNIEDDNHYFTKFRDFQLTVGYLLPTRKR